MGTAVSEAEQELNLESLEDLRHQHLIFKMTRELISRCYCDEDGNPEFQKFNKLRGIVEEWYESKVICYGDCFKQLLWWCMLLWESCFYLRFFMSVLIFSKDYL